MISIQLLIKLTICWIVVFDYGAGTGQEQLLLHNSTENEDDVGIDLRDLGKRNQRPEGAFTNDGDTEIDP